MYVCISEFLISLGQIGSTMVSVCTIGTLERHLEPLNKELMLLVTILTAPLAQRENCAVSNKKLFGPMVHHISLSEILNGCMYITVCLV